MHDEEMVSDATTFWERRNDLTPATDAGSSIESYRLVLLADVTDSAVVSGFDRLSDGLDRFECFDPSSCSVLHITVKLFDVEVDPSTTGVEGACPAVRQVDTAVSEAVAGYEPFEVELTRFNLFPDVVYGEIADDGQLTRLNRQMCDHSGIATLDRDRDNFIPHLTFGYFSGDTDYGALVDFLETNRELGLPTIPVEDIALVAYEVGGRPPTYNQLETYDLRDGS